MLDQGLYDQSVEVSTSNLNNNHNKNNNNNLSLVKKHTTQSALHEKFLRMVLSLKIIDINSYFKNSFV